MRGLAAEVRLTPLILADVPQPAASVLSLGKVFSYTCLCLVSPAKRPSALAGLTSEGYRWSKARANEHTPPSPTTSDEDDSAARFLFSGGGRSEGRGLPGGPAVMPESRHSFGARGRSPASSEGSGCNTAMRPFVATLTNGLVWSEHAARPRGVAARRAARRRQEHLCYWRHHRIRTLRAGGRRDSAIAGAMHRGHFVAKCPQNPNRIWAHKTPRRQRSVMR